MVPGSTLMYGSSFAWVTRKPRASRSAPTEALAKPFPMEETTPPVTNTYFVGLRLIVGPPCRGLAYWTVDREAVARGLFVLCSWSAFCFVARHARFEERADEN